METGGEWWNLNQAVQLPARVLPLIERLAPIACELDVAILVVIFDSRLLWDKCSAWTAKTGGGEKNCTEGSTTTHQSL